jgi:acyl carrier protein
MGQNFGVAQQGTGSLEAIIERLRHLVAEDLDLNLKVEEIDPDSQLLDGGLKLDSLTIVKLISRVEQDFRLEFGEDDLRMESFASLRALAGTIASHGSGRAAQA